MANVGDKVGNSSINDTIWRHDIKNRIPYQTAVFWRYFNNYQRQILASYRSFAWILSNFRGQFKLKFLVDTTLVVSVFEFSKHEALANQ